MIDAMGLVTDVSYALDNNLGNSIGEGIKDPRGTLHRGIERSSDALNWLRQVNRRHRRAGNDA